MDPIQALDQINQLLRGCLDNDDPAGWEEYFYLLEEIDQIVKQALVDG